MTKLPSRFYAWQIVIAAAVAAGLVLSFRSWQWDSVRSGIRRAYPQLRQIEPGKLAGWLKDPDDPRPLLLDVRERAEYDLSHLPEARWIPPGAVPSDLTLPAEKDTPIVVYCATGQRSAGLARRLQAAGYTRVSLLDGGLFRWANEDYILIAAHGPATTVHPADPSVEHLLKRERRAALP